MRVFPTRLSPPFVIALIHGEQAVTSDLLMACFKRYVSPLDADVIDKAVEGKLEDEDHDDLIDILSRAECHALPSGENMTETVLSAAHKELIQVPKYALDAMASTTARRVLKLINQTPQIETKNKHWATSSNTSEDWTLQH